MFNSAKEVLLYFQLKSLYAGFCPPWLTGMPFVDNYLSLTPPETEVCMMFISSDCSHRKLAHMHTYTEDRWLMGARVPPVPVAVVQHQFMLQVSDSAVQPTIASTQLHTSAP